MILLLCAQIAIKFIIRVTYSCFDAISGLKVNIQKLELVVVGEVPHQEELADILSCIICNTPYFLNMNIYENKYSFIKDPL